jgi:hypothetical protein
MSGFVHLAKKGVVHEISTVTSIMQFLSLRVTSDGWKPIGGSQKVEVDWLKLCFCSTDHSNYWNRRTT